VGELVGEEDGGVVVGAVGGIVGEVVGILLLVVEVGGPGGTVPKEGVGWQV
jgi:hypothetical protein